MRVKVLGGHGGASHGFSTTSFLLNDHLLVDAGGVTASLSVDQQAKIDHILITHVHLDHIKDLAFISDNCFGLRKDSFKVFSHPTVIHFIKTHLLNDIIWPDFSKLPSVEKPTMSFHPIDPSKAQSIGEYRVTAIKVNHAHDAMGYIIEKEDKAILFTGDTGPTDEIWRIAKGIKNLKAIFTEVSFPNSLQAVADISDHHTAKSMKDELQKMPAGIPVILTHLKPNFRDVIMKEVRELQNPLITVLEKDGQAFTF